MKRFIWKRIPPEGETIVLADGGDGPVAAHITPLGDDPQVWIDIEFSSTLPEWVTLETIYHYYRQEDLTWADWREQVMNDWAASRYKELVSRGTQLFAEHFNVAVHAPSARVDVEREATVAAVFPPNGPVMPDTLRVGINEYGPFTPSEMRILSALWGKAQVDEGTLVEHVYGTDEPTPRRQFPENSLEKLVKRLRSKLFKQNVRVAIHRKGQYYIGSGRRCLSRMCESQFTVKANTIL
jgi:hypothetical protein